MVIMKLLLARAVVSAPRHSACWCRVAHQGRHASRRWLCRRGGRVRRGAGDPRAVDRQAGEALCIGVSRRSALRRPCWPW